MADYKETGNERRKRSGFTMAYQSLLSLIQSFDEGINEDAQVGERQDETVEWTDGVYKELERLRTLFEEKLRPRGAQVSGINEPEDILKHLNIVDTANDLFLKSDWQERVERSRLLGSTQYMSSDDMYRHLNMLENLVPRSSEASARLWIDTFLFRTSAMVPTGQTMVLFLEPSVPSVPENSTTIAGKINYTAIVADARRSKIIFTAGDIQSVRQRCPTGFFVMEAKLDDRVDPYLPQAVAEMYGCAKNLQKDIVRGALTNGYEWIFLILYLNKDGKGASYKRSQTITIDISSPPGPKEVKKPQPDLIAGVLSYWIENSFQDLGNDDWFTY